MKMFLMITATFLLLSGCAKQSDGLAPGTDSESPTFTTPLTFSARTSSTFTISWAATDVATSAAALEYEVIYSLNDNISTVAAAQANGTVMTAWTANLTTMTFNSMSQATRYYVTVLVRDSEGNISISTGSANTLCSGRIMYLTSVPNGNLGGAGGADTICNNNKPAGFSASTFKALLTDGTTRRACFISGNDVCNNGTVTGRTDWPLANNQTYCSADYETRVGTTSSTGILTVTAANTLSSTTTSTYTGFNVSWGSSATNCSNFLSTSGSGIAGSGNASGNNFFANGTFPTCSTAGTIYCAQQ